MSDDPISDQLTDAMLKARQAFIDAVAAWCAHPPHRHEPTSWDDPDGPPPRLSLGSTWRPCAPFSTPSLRFQRSANHPWEWVS